MRRRAAGMKRRTGILLSLECTVSRLGERYLASCDKLGVSDQGATEEEARNNFGISLNLFLNEFKALASLGAVLKERGVRYTVVHADRSLPGIMKTAQVLPGIEIPAPRNPAAVGDREIRRISVPVYLWPRTTRRLAAV